MKPKDIECPYCGAEQNIDHDDGTGYAEDEIHQQHCTKCEKYFAFTTMVSYSYDVAKADCLNDGEHKWEATYTYLLHATKMVCIQCGERRTPSEGEWIEIKKKDKEKGGDA